MLLRAVGQDRVDPETHPGGQRDADRLVDPAQFFDGDTEVGETPLVQSGPTELFGRVEPKQTQLPHRRDELAREVRASVPVADMGLDLLRREVAHQRPEVLVILAQFIHGRPTFLHTHAGYLTSTSR